MKYINFIKFYNMRRAIRQFCSQNAKTYLPIKNRYFSKIR